MKDMTEYIADCNQFWDESKADNRAIYEIFRVAIPNTLAFEFRRYLDARKLPHMSQATVTAEAMKVCLGEWENRP